MLTILVNYRQTVEVTSPTTSCAVRRLTGTFAAEISGVDLTYGEPALTTPAGIFAYSDIKRLMRQ